MIGSTRGNALGGAFDLRVGTAPPGWAAWWTPLPTRRGLAGFSWGPQGLVYGGGWVRKGLLARATSAPRKGRTDRVSAASIMGVGGPGLCPRGRVQPVEAGGADAVRHLGS